MTNEVRVRYAPSPTGHLHIGNTRTALFNYLFARNQGGKFIIRIEDTDQKRNVEGGEQSQLHYLKWLGLDWDESIDKDGGYGPYRQMERLDIYDKYWHELLEKGQAYKCYCTEEELEQEREEQLSRGMNPHYAGKCRNLTADEVQQFEGEGRKPNIRFKVPQDKTYTFVDMVKNEVSFDSNGIGDWVIVKKDGIPTYNFAVAIDDHLMEISHVLRGDEHITNTPKQLMVFEALGWEPPTFAHMTLIVNENKKKLSKRDESIIQFIAQYEQLGYLPEAMLNFIALLGWSPGGEEEIFSKEEFIEKFDADRLSKSPAVFDTKKLEWINNQYIKKAELDQVVGLAVPHLVKAGKIEAEMTVEKKEWVEKLIALYKDQMSYGAEITSLTELFFKADITYNEEALAILKEEQVPEVLKDLLVQFQELEAFEPQAIKDAIKATQKATGHKGKKLFMPIRVAATGQEHGPDLLASLALLGYEVVKARMEDALKIIEE